MDLAHTLLARNERELGGQRENPAVAQDAAFSARRGLASSMYPTSDCHSLWMVAHDSRRVLHHRGAASAGSGGLKSSFPAYPPALRVHSICWILSARSTYRPRAGCPVPRCSSRAIRVLGKYASAIPSLCTQPYYCTEQVGMLASPIINAHRHANLPSTLRTHSLCNCTVCVCCAPYILLLCRSRDYRGEIDNTK